MGLLILLGFGGRIFTKQFLKPLLPDTEKNAATRSSTGSTWRQGDPYYEMRDLSGKGYMIG